MTILPKAIYRFNAIAIKLPTAFFTELEQKFHYLYENTQVSKYPKQTRQLRRKLEKSTILISDYTTKLQSVKTAWYWHKNRNTDQWNKIESPEINTHTYGYLIFDIAGKNIQWRKESLFNKWCWENWSTTCKRMKLEYLLTPYTKINSNWIKDLNVRPDTIKLFEENIGSTFFDINNSNNLSDSPPRVTEIKTKINSGDLIKLKSFCKANYKQDEKTTLRMGGNKCLWNNWGRINLQNI